MKEFFEFRIDYDYAHLLFKPGEGRDLGTSVKVVVLTKDDPRYERIYPLNEYVRKQYGMGFYYGWKIKRIYTKQELDAASLFWIKIKTAFEPTGEECGTVYDESVACNICGTNRKQIGLLRLKKGSIPKKKDICRTIAGEVVLSKRFTEVYRQWGLNGLVFDPIVYKLESEDSYQLRVLGELVLTNKTIVGDDPFYTTKDAKASRSVVCGYEIFNEAEVYICPNGDLLGLNLLSEPYVKDDPVIKKLDFFASRQKIGVKRGLLRPEPVYLCSPRFRQMVIEEKLTGFDFEVAYIDKE